MRWPNYLRLFLLCVAGLYVLDVSASFQASSDAHEGKKRVSSIDEALTPLDVTSQIDALLILKDPLSANALCSRALKKWPENTGLIERALTAKRKMRDKEGLLDHYISKIHDNPGLKANIALTEELCWGLIEWGSSSSQEAHRQMALISAAISMQSEGVLLLEKALENPSYAVRGLAIYLCRAMRDSRLENVLIRRLSEEVDGGLRLLIIEVLSEIGGVNAHSALKAMIGSDIPPHIERKTAQKALLQMHRLERKEEVKSALDATSPELRAYGARLAMHLKCIEALPRLKELAKDPFASVRTEALYALGAFQEFSELGDESHDIKELLSAALDDHNPSVQMMAARLSIAENPKAKKVLSHWLFSENLERSRQAAGALSASGPFGIDLVKEGFQKSSDLEVKMILSQTLLAHRTWVDEAGGFLKGALVGSSAYLGEKRAFGAFDVIAPSSYTNPLNAKSEDLNARLKLIDLILASGYHAADELLRPFLESRQWGSIFGIATLMIKREPEYALSKIAEFLDDERLHIRAQAAIICSTLKADPKAAGVLKEVFYNPKASRELRLHALEALMHFPAKRDINFFLEALSTPYEVLQLVLAGCILSSLNH